MSKELTNLTKTPTNLTTGNASTPNRSTGTSTSPIISSKPVSPPKPINWNAIGKVTSKIKTGVPSNIADILKEQHLKTPDPKYNSYITHYTNKNYSELIKAIEKDHSITQIVEYFGEDIDETIHNVPLQTRILYVLASHHDQNPVDQKLFHWNRPLNARAFAIAKSMLTHDFEQSYRLATTHPILYQMVIESHANAITVPSPDYQKKAARNATDLLMNQLTLLEELKIQRTANNVNPRTEKKAYDACEEYKKHLARKKTKDEKKFKQWMEEEENVKNLQMVAYEFDNGIIEKDLLQKLSTLIESDRFPSERKQTLKEIIKFYKEKKMKEVIALIDELPNDLSYLYTWDYLPTIKINAMLSLKRNQNAIHFIMGEKHNPAIPRKDELLRLAQARLYKFPITPLTADEFEIFKKNSTSKKSEVSEEPTDLLSELFKPVLKELEEKFTPLAKTLEKIQAQIQSEENNNPQEQEKPSYWAATLAFILAAAGDPRVLFAGSIISLTVGGLYAWNRRNFSNSRSMILTGLTTIEKDIDDYFKTYSDEKKPSVLQNFDFQKTKLEIENLTYAKMETLETAKKQIDVLEKFLNNFRLERCKAIIEHIKLNKDIAETIPSFKSLDIAECEKTITSGNLNKSILAIIEKKLADVKTPLKKITEEIHANKISRLKTINKILIYDGESGFEEDLKKIIDEINSISQTTDLTKIDAKLTALQSREKDMAEFYESKEKFLSSLDATITAIDSVSKKDSSKYQKEFEKLSMVRKEISSYLFENKKALGQKKSEIEILQVAILQESLAIRLENLQFHITFLMATVLETDPNSGATIGDIKKFPNKIYPGLKKQIENAKSMTDITTLLESISAQEKKFGVKQDEKPISKKLEKQKTRPTIPPEVPRSDEQTPVSVSETKNEPIVGSSNASSSTQQPDKKPLPLIDQPFSLSLPPTIEEREKKEYKTLAECVFVQLKEFIPGDSSVDFSDFDAYLKDMLEEGIPDIQTQTGCDLFALTCWLWLKEGMPNLGADVNVDILILEDGKSPVISSEKKIPILLVYDKQSGKYSALQKKEKQERMAQGKQKVISREKLVKKLPFILPGAINDKKEISAFTSAVKDIFISKISFQEKRLAIMALSEKGEISKDSWLYHHILHYLLVQEINSLSDKLKEDKNYGVIRNWISHVGFITDIKTLEPLAKENLSFIFGFSNIKTEFTKKPWFFEAQKFKYTNHLGTSLIVKKNTAFQEKLFQSQIDLIPLLRDLYKEGSENEQAVISMILEMGLSTMGEFNDPGYVDKNSNLYLERNIELKRILQWDQLPEKYITEMDPLELCDEYKNNLMHQEGALQDIAKKIFLAILTPVQLAKEELVQIIPPTIVELPPKKDDTLDKPVTPSTTKKASTTKLSDQKTFVGNPSGQPPKQGGKTKQIRYVPIEDKKPTEGNRSSQPPPTTPKKK